MPSGQIQYFGYYGSDPMQSTLLFGPGILCCAVLCLACGLSLVELGRKPLNKFAFSHRIYI